MSTKKLTITIPEETLKRLRVSAHKSHARSISSYVSRVIEQHENEMTYSEYLDMFEPTPEEQAWANKVLGITS